MSTTLPADARFDRSRDFAKIVLVLGASSIVLFLLGLRRAPVRGRPQPACGVCVSWLRRPRLPTTPPKEGRLDGLDGGRARPTSFAPLRVLGLGLRVQSRRLITNQELPPWPGPHPAVGQRAAMSPEPGGRLTRQSDVV